MQVVVYHLIFITHCGQGSAEISENAEISFARALHIQDVSYCAVTLSW